MALERQVTFWVAALAVFVAVLWLLSDVLLPFVAGMALAYLLDPIARRAERLGIGRGVSALIVVTLVIVALVVAVMAGGADRRRAVRRLRGQPAGLSDQAAIAGFRSEPAVARQDLRRQAARSGQIGRRRW